MKPIQKQSYQEILERNDAVFVDEKSLIIPYVGQEGYILVFFYPDHNKIRHTKVRGDAAHAFEQVALKPNQHPYIVIYPEDEKKRVILQCFEAHGAFKIEVLHEQAGNLHYNRKFSVEG